MKTLGMIGGIGPESTIEYYRLLVAAHRERARDGSSPRIVINSIDLREMLALAVQPDPRPLTEFLAAEVRKLALAGADLGLLAANTPHVVFDALSRASALPLVSIVEATRDAAKRRGLRRLGLFGTRVTMGGRFYPEVFEPAGIALVVPATAEQDYIHEKYLGELVNGIVRPETREGLVAIVRRLKAEERIDGLILGGTELPLILREPEIEGVPLLDTTRLHVEAAASRLWS